MQKRETVRQIFSTFLQFENDRVSHWLSDPKLLRSIEQCLSQSSQSQANQHFWALYWHKVWQIEKSPLAFNHLCAYLQEASYWVAKNIAMNFSSHLSYTDLFQIALLKIEKILQAFKPQQGTNLEQFARVVFRSMIKDELRQRREVDICTDWALLHKLSQKKLLESLQTQGLGRETIEDHILAWKCFNTLYAPTQAKSTRQLSEPSPAIWQEILRFYNQQNSNKPLPLENLKQRLDTCAKAARLYLYPKYVSIDAPKLGQEEGTLTLLDSLSTEFQPSLEEEIIAQENEANRQGERSQINAVLLRTLVKFDLDSQKVLQMYYGQGLTQQEIAQQLKMKQYTVSRRLASYRKKLLLALAQWSQNTLHDSLKIDVLNKINILLEEWLKVHYHHRDLSLPEVE